MLKRIFLCVLSLVILLPLVSCASQSLISETSRSTETNEPAKTGKETIEKTDEEPSTETEKAPQIEQSSWEKKMLKVLILGNSHSNDVFFQLSRVFNAQGFEQQYTLGFLYYSGCSILQHVGFAAQNQGVYDYYKSRGDGSYECREKATMKEALTDQQWDIIFIQYGASDLQDETVRLSMRRKLEAYVDEYVPTVHSFAWHSSWPAPSDPDLLKSASAERKELLQSFDYNPIKQYTVYSELVQKNILTDETYVKAINTGSAILYATNVLGVSDQALYRDHTHMSDFGRVVVAYAFYAQFTGQPIEEVKLDKIPEKARKKKGEGDLILTDSLKEIIKESANYSLQNPWTFPQT